MMPYVLVLHDTNDMIVDSTTELNSLIADLNNAKDFIIFGESLFNKEIIIGLMPAKDYMVYQIENLDLE